MNKLISLGGKGMAKYETNFKFVWLKLAKF